MYNYAESVMVPTIACWFLAMGATNVWGIIALRQLNRQSLKVLAILQGIGVCACLVIWGVKWVETVNDQRFANDTVYQDYICNCMLDRVIWHCIVPSLLHVGVV